MKLLVNILNKYIHHGWLGWLAYVYPVSFSQDSNYINNGYDILSLKKNTGYFTGTWQQRNKFLNTQIVYTYQQLDKG